MDTVAICLLLIAFSFIFSASEIALFSLSRLQLRQIKDQSEALFRRIRTLISDSIGLLITVLVFNEVLNMGIGSLITSRFIAPLPLDWKTKIFIGIFVTTPITLICCELTPKIVASRSNRAIVTLFLPIVHAFYFLMRPLVSFVKFFLPAQPVKELHQLHEEDFLILAEEHTETGHLHETELELIKNVFQMDDVRVESLAVPLRKIVTISSKLTLEQASQILLRDKIFSRVPIWGEHKEDIVGILNTKDLVELKVDPTLKEHSVMSIAKEPLIVAGNITLEALFRKMKSKKLQAAFIKNSQDKIIGMVTLQDILEMIIEEVFEE